MLEIRYFASVREALGSDGEDLPKPHGVHTVGDLIGYLRQRNPAFDKLLQGQGQSQGQQPILTAVNQTVASPQQAVGDDDEVAFFPPMTGG